MLGQMMPYQLTIQSVIRHASRLFSDTEIVSVTADHPQHRYTLGDALERAAKLANAFKSIGLKSGDRVATIAWNDFRHFELYFGISGYGGVTHTINPRLHPEQLIFIMNDASDKVLFIDSMFVPLIDAIRPQLKTVEHIIVMTSDADAVGDYLMYEDFIAAQPNTYPWPEDTDEHQAAALCYTSGTTGNPKGVLYSHRTMLLHAMSLSQPDALGMGRNSVILPVVPMFHINAWSIPFVCAMVGTKIVFPGPKVMDFEALTDMLIAEKVTLTAGVPTVWAGMAQYLQKSGKKIPSVERMVFGGTACPPYLLDYYNKEHNINVIHAWGMTETSPLGTCNTVLPTVAKSWSAEEQRTQRLKQGYPVFGVELKILDDAGAELPWDGKTQGYLYIRGLWVCDGYINQPDSRGNDWFNTGDIAVIDQYGCMRIMDRAKDLVKSGGEWISSSDIENIVQGHPDILQAAVIATAHPKWDERPLLIVVPKEGVQVKGDELLKYLEGKVATWWIPDDVLFAESLPINATGKVQKNDLRGIYKDYRHADFDQ